jgi:hypothetical protein
MMRGMKFPKPQHEKAEKNPSQVKWNATEGRRRQEKKAQTLLNISQGFFFYKRY